MSKLKSSNKKLSLNTETVRVLDDGALDDVFGGNGSAPGAKSTAVKDGDGANERNTTAITCGHPAIVAGPLSSLRGR